MVSHVQQSCFHTRGPKSQTAWGSEGLCGHAPGSRTRSQPDLLPDPYTPSLQGLLPGSPTAPQPSLCSKNFTALTAINYFSLLLSHDTLSQLGCGPGRAADTCPVHPTARLWVRSHRRVSPHPKHLPAQTVPPAPDHLQHPAEDLAQVASGRH